MALILASDLIVWLQGKIAEAQRLAEEGRRQQAYDAVEFFDGAANAYQQVLTKISKP